MKKRLLAVAIFLAIVTLPVAGWTLYQNRRCAEMVHANTAAVAYDVHDVRIARDSSGRCYLCRPEGPLFDIVYAHCPD